MGKSRRQGDISFESPCMPFASGKCSPIWDSDLKWFNYGMETVTIRIIPKPLMSYDSMFSSELGAQTDLDCCLCWRWRQLSCAKDGPLTGALFHRTDQLFDEAGCRIRLFGCGINRTPLSSQFWAFSLGRIWPKAVWHKNRKHGLNSSISSVPPHILSLS